MGFPVHARPMAPPTKRLLCWAIATRGLDPRSVAPGLVLVCAETQTWRAFTAKVSCSTQGTPDMPNPCPLSAPTQPASRQSGQRGNCDAGRYIQLDRHGPARAPAHEARPRAGKWPCTKSAAAEQASRYTSATRTGLGGAAPTKTRLVWCASTCPGAVICLPTTRNNPTPSLANSVPARARGWGYDLQQTPSANC